MPSAKVSSLSRLQLMLEMLQFLANEPAPSKDGILHLLEGLCEITQASAARIVLRGGDGAFVALGVWTERIAQVDHALYQYVASQGILEATPLDTLFVGAQVDELAERLSHVMALPLTARGRELGILWLGFPQQPLWQEDERLLVDMVTAQIAVALANLQRLERHTDNSTEQLPYAAMLESLRDAVVMLDKHLVVRYVNHTACRLFGVTLENAIGKRLEEVAPDEQLYGFVTGTLAGERHRFFLLHEETAYQPLLSDLMVDGVKVGQLLVLADVTHFKRQTENMTLFLQTVSHDLRSPLTAAKGFMDMMPMVGELNEKQHAMRERVLVSIVDMTNLVEKVLDAGRLDPEMGAYQLRRELVHPGNIVEKVVSNLTPAAQKKNLTLSKEVGEGIPMMTIDEMMLERALMNLVENAIKYTPEGGEIWVRAYAENHYLHFAVVDNGFGIPADKQATIFDKGSRVRRVEHKSIRGSGLGLFIVKNVAQQHGGDASLYSVEGEGSEFHIAIPIAGQNLTGGTGQLKPFV